VCQILEVDDEWNPALKRGTKNFHYTSKTCGIFSDLNFPRNENPNGGYEGLGVL
jgi:hypothetical protein